MARRLTFQRIGVVIGDRRLVAAQVRPGQPDKPTAALELEFESRDWLNDADAAGARLKAALKQNGFIARRAAVGLPASWAMSRHYPMPPMPSAQLAEALKLVTERIFSIDPGEVRVDFVPPSDGDYEPVLVMATLQRRLTQVLAVMAAAGLEVSAITPAVVALAQADADGDRFVARLTETAVEVAHAAGRRLRSMRQVGVDDQSTAESIAGELRRSLSAAPDQTRRIRLYAPEQASPAAVAAVEMLGLDVDQAEPLRPVGLHAAVACAVLAADPESAAINFAHGRLETPPRRRFDRRTRIGGLSAAAAVVLIGGLILLVHRQERSVADLRAQLQDIEPDVKAARGLIDRVQTAEQWFAHRPRYLDALKRLTLAFPTSSDIWVTEVNFRADQPNVMTGRAVASQAVISLLDELKRTPACRNVTLLYDREAGRGESQRVFGIALRIDLSPPGAAAAETAETLAAGGEGQ